MNDYFVTAVSAICARSDLLKQNLIFEGNEHAPKKLGFNLNL